jgi:hypothetical protein
MPTLRERFTDVLLGDEKRRLQETAALWLQAYQEGPYHLPPEQLVAQLAEIDSAILYDAVQRLTWERMGAGYGGDEERERTRAVDESRRLWRYDVLAGWSIQLWTDYGFGENISIKPLDEAAIEPWLEFWEADRNQSVLAADELHHLSNTLKVDGETILVFYTSTLDGETTIRTIDTQEITEIVTDPEDNSTPLFYKRVWTDKQSVSRTWYYPDWLVTMTGEIPDDVLPGNAIRADEQGNGTTVCILNIADNRKGGMRGWPLSTAAAPWSRAHKQFRENRTSIAAGFAMFFQTLTHEGGSRARDNIKAQLQSAFVTGGQTETNPPPVAATFLQNKAATLERLPMSTGAGDAKEDGQALAWQALLGFGLFPHYAGMGDAYRLATATSMEKPLLMQFSRYQLFWSAQFRKMVRIVLTMAERYGGASFETYEAEVSTDRLVEVDLVAVSSAVTALFRETLFPAVEAGLIPSETAQRIVAIIWRIALQALGVVDADEVASDEAFGVGEEVEAAVSAAVRVTRENLEAGTITAEQAAEHALGMLLDRGQEYQLPPSDDPRLDPRSMKRGVLLDRGQE